MPYVITTTRLREVTQRGSLMQGYVVNDVIDRKAVATPEEAGEYVDKLVRDLRDSRAPCISDIYPAGRQIHRITTEGGSIDLPDGTRIEIEPISGYVLLQRIPVDRRPSPWSYTTESGYIEAICAAFNAAHEG